MHAALIIRVVNAGCQRRNHQGRLIACVGSNRAKHPAAVIVEFGGNDGLRGLPIVESQKNLTGIVDALQQSGTKIMLVEVSLPASVRRRLYQPLPSDLYPAVAHQAHIPLLTFAELTRGLTFDAAHIQDDGIHPTAAGDAILAKNIADYLAPKLNL